MSQIPTSSASEPRSAPTSSTGRAAELPLHQEGRATTSLRRQLFVVFGVVLVASLLLTAQTLATLLPRLGRPQDAIGLLVGLLAVVLAFVAVLGSWFLRTRLVRPVEHMVDDVRRIASGEDGHRVAEVDVAELAVIRDSVNAMADALTRNQEALAENVVSLDRTNAELVAARDEVIQAARLASVGTLASGIAHEVGNPLGALMAFTDLAIQRARREGEDTEVLESIREEARRIDRIIRTLLEYARGRESTSGDFQVPRVVERVHQLLEAQGKLEGVEVQWPEVEGTLPPVPGEPQQLEQILVNLVLNALDAMKDSDEPRLRIEVSEESGRVADMPIRREEDPPGLNYLHRRRIAKDREPGGPDPLFTASGVVAIVVQDWGPGIPSENLDRVFDPFFTTKEPGEGTGLGLAICARLAEGMGGRMVADNAPHGGARFTIRLPVVRQETET